MTQIFCKIDGELKVFEASKHIDHNLAKDLLLSSGFKSDGAIMLVYI
jgi:hypothetical protein